MMKAKFWVDKKVLITGGTEGLGRALAEEALRRGARVAVVARRAFGRSPQGAVSIQADIGKKEDIHRISAETIARLGGLDILINNASILGSTPLKLLLDTDCEELAAVLETNLIGPFRLTKALLPTLLLGQGGTVVNISSDAAVQAYPRWGAYSVSKAGLDHLSRIWGEELSAHGIRFMAVDPGEMDTDMHAAAIPEADRSILKSPQAAALQLLQVIETDQKLLVAPVQMKKSFLGLIETETSEAMLGRPAQIIAKMNSLEDLEIIAALYEASNAGVQIDLVVRGFCCLCPGIKGMSENIRVSSVIGRFLEHSRVFYFRSGAKDPLDGQFFIGSADWMHRNLSYRVEAIVPIEDRALKTKLHEYLQILLSDRRQSWDLLPNGTYVQRTPLGDDDRDGVHERLMKIYESTPIRTRTAELLA